MRRINFIVRVVALALFTGAGISHGSTPILHGVNTAEICAGLDQITRAANVSDLRCATDRRSGELTITHIRNGGHEVNYRFTASEYRALAANINEGRQIEANFNALTQTKAWKDMSNAERDLRRAEVHLTYMNFYKRACGLGTHVGVALVGAGVITFFKAPNGYSALAAVVGGGMYFGGSYCEELMEVQVEKAKEKVEGLRLKLDISGNNSGSTASPGSISGGGASSGPSGGGFSGHQVCTTGTVYYDGEPGLPQLLCHWVSTNEP